MEPNRTTNIGDEAAIDRSILGDGNTQTNIETQTYIAHQIVESARPSGARFSLPRPQVDFTGRTLEIETLVNQLTQTQRAAITGVAGMGGIGKSALAAVVANRVAPNFPDAQLWLDLRGTDTPSTKPSDTMRQVIVAFEPLADLRNADDAQIEQLYKSVLHGKRALIVLDNAKDNVQLRPLLQAEATFLVTARATLTEGGMKALRLDVMKDADARDYLMSLVERLSAAQAEELAETCGYLPLALKIAGSYLAARANVNPSQYAAQLKQRRLELLRERDDLELNVEVAFDETYRQLPLELQVMWRLLAVFPAPFWGIAARYVWGIEDEMKAEGALGDLLRESLIEYDADEKKYRLHDLLREFGWGRMSEDERGKAQTQHAEFYKNVARTADDLYLEGRENVVAGLKLFDEELVHIRAGQSWAALNMDRNDDAANLCSDYPLQYAGSAVISLRLISRERIRWMEQAAIAAKRLGNKLHEEIHLGNLGLAYADLGEVRRAIEFYEQALVIDREIGDRPGEGDDLGNLGNAYADLGEVRRAIEFYEQALVIDREIGDRRGEGNILGNLGSAYYRLGEMRRAVELYEQTLVIVREIGDRRGEGSDLGNLGNAYADLGEVRRAIEFYEQQLVIVREIGDHRGEGNALGNLGNAYANLGEVRRAIEFYEQVLVIHREMGNRLGEGNDLRNLGVAYADLGEVRRAIEFYEQGLVIAREIGDRRGEGTALGNLGNAYAGLGEVPRAIKLYEQQLVIVREIGDRAGEGRAVGNLGLAYVELGDVQRALGLYEEGLGIAREIGAKGSEAYRLRDMGRAYDKLGNRVKAKELWNQSLKIFEAIEHREAKTVRGLLEEGTPADGENG